MKSRRGSGILAIMALVAVGIYSLSCKPAWSPDSGKVAYIGVSKVGEDADPLDALIDTIKGSADDKSDEQPEEKEDPRYSAAVYDLKTRECKAVFGETRDESGLHMVPMEVFWPTRGNELVIVSSSADDSAVKGGLLVSAYDLRKNATRVLQHVSDATADISQSLAPMILQDKRWLWLHGGKKEDECFRMDLRKGRVTELGRDLMLFGTAKKVFFVKEAFDGGLVVGRMKTFWGLREKPLFTVSTQADDELVPVLAVPSRCERFACVRQRQETQTLEIYDGKGRNIGKIPVHESLDADEALTGAEWSPDGTTLWLAVEGEDADGIQYAGLAEITVAEGATRIIKLDEGGVLGDLKPLQLSLSPDGAYLAVTMMGDESVRLCLVDLRDEGRPITLAPEPVPAAPQPADAK